MSYSTFKQLPLLIDGGDGSMWPVNDNEAHWDLCIEPESEHAHRRFVRVSDLLEFLKNYDTNHELEKRL